MGIRTLKLIDASRTIEVGGRRLSRTLVTLIRYPAEGRIGDGERAGAAPARAAGPFPLVVFGHGFAVTPAPYARLLHAWAQAGFVVAAPVFPLENADAPGGPDEADLVNQPQDMSFVISRLLAAGARPSGFLAGLIDSRRIAVSGQSDGGETALAVAYDRFFLDRRVGAAMILSGARIPNAPGFDSLSDPGRRTPPLLAVQGTADTINPPSFTAAFFTLVPRPKFLLALPGAGHLPPYTVPGPQLSAVERVTIAFLRRYLEHLGRGSRAISEAAGAPGVARLTADP